MDGTSPQRSDIRLLLVARGIRGFGDGFAAIVLPAYLVAIGFGTVEIGIVAAASLFGSALLTLGVGVVAPRYELRHLLIAGAVLMAATGVMLNVEDLLLIVVVAFIGTVNPSGGDVGMLVPLEQTMLTRDVTDRDRTRVFARYSLVGAMSSAAGALSAAVPDVLVDAGIGRITAFKLMFCCYGVLGLLAAALYRRLRQSRAEQHHASTPLGPSRGMVYKLAALFSLDAFAGGFVVQSLSGAVAVQAFRHLAVGRQPVLFLDQRAERLVVSAGQLARPAFRPRQHHGVHSHPVEPLPYRGGVRAQSRRRSRPASGALRAVANGRADAHLLRHGRGDAGRAGGGGERHGGAAQPGVLDQPGLGRRSCSGLPFPGCRSFCAGRSRSSTTWRCSTPAATSNRPRKTLAIRHKAGPAAGRFASGGRGP